MFLTRNDPKFHELDLKPITEIKLKGKDREGNEVYHCPICYSGEVTRDVSVFYGRCDTCGATSIIFEPTPFQNEVLNSTAKTVLQISGYGSGKTTLASLMVALHCMIVDKARVGVLAPTLSLLREAVLPELIKFLPPWLIKKQINGNKPSFELVNGSKILALPTNNSENLKSYNFTMFYIEEASAVDKEVFDQLKARTRNTAGISKRTKNEKTKDDIFGIVSTNPKDSWPITDLLMKSETIYGTKHIDMDHIEPMRAEKHQRVKLFASYMATTYDNPNLPEGYIESAISGNSQKWVDEMIMCKIGGKDLLVYQDYANHLVEPFEIPDSWHKIIGLDPGFRDPFSLFIAAIDPETGIIYAFKEYYQTERTISENVRELVKIAGDYKMLYPIQGDKSDLGKTLDINAKTRLATFMERIRSLGSNIQIEPGNNNIDYGVEKIRDYMAEGKLKFFNNLYNLKKELKSFSNKSKTESFGTADRYKQKDNHLMDAMRYAIGPLPENPVEMTKSFLDSKFISGGMRNVSNQTRESTLNSNEIIHSGMKGSGDFYTSGFRNEGTDFSKKTKF